MFKCICFKNFPHGLRLNVKILKSAVNSKRSTENHLKYGLVHVALHKVYGAAQLAHDLAGSGFCGLKMPDAGHSQVMQMDGTLAVVLGILLHCIQNADAALEAPLEVLSVQKHHTRLKAHIKDWRTTCPQDSPPQGQL